MAKIVDYYFSPVSPWTYLGHARFTAMLQRCSAQPQVKPVDFGKIFSVSGGLPLKQRAPQRQAYRMVELRRFRDHLGVPLNLEPKFFPVPTDDAALLIIAADRQQGASAAMGLAGAILRACWAEERNIGDAQTLAQIAREQGLNDAALREQAAQARAVYDGYTQEAIERQVFGAPTYILFSQASRFGDRTGSTSWSERLHVEHCADSQTPYAHTPVNKIASRVL